MYIKVFDDIWGVFVDIFEVWICNFMVSYFSFNVDGGCCEKC